MTVATTTSDHALVSPSRRARRWARENLFRSWLDGIVTVVAAVVIAYLVFRIGRFVFVTGRWEIVRRNLRLFLVGRYPADSLWLLAASVSALAAYGGLFAGYLHRHRAADADDPAPRPSPISRTAELVGRFWPLLLALAVLLPLTRTAGPSIAAAGIAAAAAAGRLVGPRLPRRALLPLVVAGVALPVALLAVISAGARLDRWGGLFICFVLAAAGIALCFPLGVLLALGRRAGRRSNSRFGGLFVGALLPAAPIAILALRGFDASSPITWALVVAAVGLAVGGYAIGRASTLPLVRVVSVTYIEFFRGVPLYVLLLLGGVAIGFFLPLGMSTPHIVIRATIVFILFTAAYIAEIVRGGLQSLPRGQIEAAQALGLSPVKTTMFIVLPQALRNVIPAIVGQFISLFKDTTLAGAAMGVFELLRVGRSTLSQDDFFGRGLAPEVYIFVSFLFWVGCITMSRESQRLERKLGVGVR